MIQFTIYKKKLGGMQACCNEMTKRKIFDIISLDWFYFGLTEWLLSQTQQLTEQKYEQILVFVVQSLI